jgi:hypothetical protein
MKTKALIIATIFLVFSSVFVATSFSHDGEKHENTKRSMERTYEEGSGSSAVNEYENSKAKPEQAVEEGSGTVNKMQGINARSQENYDQMKQSGEQMMKEKSAGINNSYEEGSDSIRIPTN